MAASRVATKVGQSAVLMVVLLVEWTDLLLADLTVDHSAASLAVQKVVTKVELRAVQKVAWTAERKVDS